jgi:hypothetical protein
MKRRRLGKKIRKNNLNFDEKNYLFYRFGEEID